MISEIQVYINSQETELGISPLTTWTSFDGGIRINHVNEIREAIEGVIGYTGAPGDTSLRDFLTRDIDGNINPPYVTDWLDGHRLSAKMPIRGMYIEQIRKKLPAGYWCETWSVKPVEVLDFTTADSLVNVYDTKDVDWAKEGTNIIDADNNYWHWGNNTRGFIQLGSGAIGTVVFSERIRTLTDGDGSYFQLDGVTSGSIPEPSHTHFYSKNEYENFFNYSFKEAGVPSDNHLPLRVKSNSMLSFEFVNSFGTTTTGANTYLYGILVPLVIRRVGLNTETDESGTSTSTTNVTLLHGTVMSIAGIWLSTDTSHTGTNYFTGGSVNPITSVVTLGTPLPNPFPDPFTSVISTYDWDTEIVEIGTTAVMARNNNGVLSYKNCSSFVELGTYSKSLYDIVHGILIDIGMPDEDPINWCVTRLGFRVESIVVGNGGQGSVSYTVTLRNICAKPVSTYNFAWT
jgi:hypothetical protein